ncbi:uncharacterized protein LOC135829614 isoform X2 [Sycon ciliatum]|uniref:uncharacterized protein LOC135829614 isoform X2 n=1 Tax=Sycon ciliatum TaxID=27933 RepID=UPI0031F68D39
MAERQSSVIAQPGAGLAGTAENCLKPGKDERVTVNEPPAETSSPFHSIFALEVGCDNCNKDRTLAYQGTCFLLSDLNCRKEEYIFATAAHNLFCTVCGHWLWVQIYSDLSKDQFLTKGKISRKNENGWLIVPDWYKKNAKDAEKNSNPDPFRHDYGIIAAKKGRCKCPLTYWVDENLLGVATKCQEEEDDVRMCGYPVDVYTYRDGKEESQTAEKRKYWVDKPRRAEFAEHGHQLHHFVDSSGGQSGSPVFLLPQEGEAATARTGYVVGIHVKGGDKHNLAVKLRDERGSDTTPMEDLRKWAKDPSEWLPADNVEVAEKSVKRGVRQSEQKGMHGGRRHQQQQADSGAEAPTTKEPKKKFFDDPFDHPDYVAKIDVPLKDVDGVELRQRLQKKGLLTKSQVKRLEKMSSETHNNELIGWIQSSRRYGYVALCEVIQELKVYPELLEDMNNLLPPERRVKKG